MKVLLKLTLASKVSLLYVNISLVSRPSLGLHFMPPSLTVVKVALSDGLGTGLH